jgi:hypothetical protein
MTSERDLLACRASRRATTSVSRLRVRLTRLGLRNDFGLPMLVTAHFMRKNLKRQTSFRESKSAFLPHVAATDNGQLYLSFNVVSAKSAKTSAAIQKRAIILDSFHPSNSKWW